MINKIDVLQDGQCSDFGGRPGKQATGLFYIVSYHHELVIELGEYCFDALAELSVSP